MGNLWAPWRGKYIKNVGKTKSCFLCRHLKLKDGRKSLIPYRGKHSFIILNRFPYNNGHLLISPIRHIKNLEDLSGEEANEIFSLVRRVIPILKKVYNPQGFNIGLNLGECAGTSVANHLHFHIVPRWEGDTNYMPVAGGVKVIPESLEESYKRIKSAILKSWNIKAK
jgi:ATP adenylyltransferase